MGKRFTAANRQPEIKPDITSAIATPPEESLECLSWQLGATVPHTAHQKSPMPLEGDSWDGMEGGRQLTSGSGSLTAELAAQLPSARCPREIA